MQCAEFAGAYSAPAAEFCARPGGQCVLYDRLRAAPAYNLVPVEVRSSRVRVLFEEFEELRACILQMMIRSIVSLLLDDLPKFLHNVVPGLLRGT